jgi:hypothetical protein
MAKGDSRTVEFSELVETGIRTFLGWGQEWNTKATLALSIDVVNSITTVVARLRGTVPGPVEV